VTVVSVRPGRATGRVPAPPSKSYTHRAIVAGHLAHRRYQIVHPLDSDDTRATARAVGLLGTPVRRFRDHWSLRPLARSRTRRAVSIDCGESGTTLRFVTAVAARQELPVTFHGQGRLPIRPMATLWSALKTLGASYRPRSVGAGLPVTIRGPLHGGRVVLDASESSQFASALLLVLPVLREDSTLVLRGALVSQPYLEATLAVLTAHGVRLTRSGRRFEIPGGQRYRGTRFHVPGDASSAAYLWVAAAISGGEVRVDGVPIDWPQADLAVLDLLRHVGAEVHRDRRGATVRAGPLRPFRIDLTQAPDLYPLAGVLAAAIPGTSQLSGAAHVVTKESDRRAGTAHLVRQLGARVRRTSSGLIIDGRPPLRAFRLEGEHDHRLVMSAAVAALAARGSCTIGDGLAVRKSFPEFWDRLGSVAERVGRA
jgi:3-phosphoshikimate 1-carboxyvinyltransferase